MAAVTVHRSNPGQDIDQLVASLNAAVTLVNELKDLLDAHITDGVHRAAASVNAGRALSTNAKADTIVLGY